MIATEDVRDVEVHEQFAKQLFSLTWDLVEKEDRTVEDNDRMIHAAHASRFHWGEIGTPLEFARGEWQVSRVYAVLGRHEAAIYHGDRSLALCEANGIGDFDLAFAYEALARGYRVAGDAEKRAEYARLAEKAAEGIEDEGNRERFLNELATVQGSGAAGSGRRGALPILRCHGRDRVRGARFLRFASLRSE